MTGVGLQSWGDTRTPEEKKQKGKGERKKNEYNESGKKKLEQENKRLNEYYDRKRNKTNKQKYTHVN